MQLHQIKLTCRRARRALWTLWRRAREIWTAAERVRQSLVPPSDQEAVIVSGLPRSGTSMVMQMLAAGGFPILTDGVRQPDEDNPRGYFEYEPVKRIRESADWFSEAQDKAVKIVAPLLAELPPRLACRILFIERDLDETVASQARMLARRVAAIENAPLRPQRLKEEYAALVHRVKAFLTKRPGTRVLYLEYGCVLADPQAAADAINAFLEADLDTAAMAAQVERRIS